MKRTKKHLRTRESEHERARDTDQLLRDLSPAHHKRLLTYLNAAGSPFDLMTIPARPMSDELEAHFERLSLAMRHSLVS